MNFKTFRINKLINRFLRLNVLGQMSLLAVSYFGFASLFAGVYCNPLKGQIKYAYKEDTKDTELLKCLHYSLTTQATVGYGDFYPIGNARWIAAFQAFLGILLNSAFLGVIVFRIIKREANIIFPEYCCYDPDKNTFVFRFFNADADDLIQVRVTLSLRRQPLEQEDPFISHRGYGIALDFFEDVYAPSNLLTAVRSVSDGMGNNATEGQLKPVNNIISPLSLRERGEEKDDDVLILAVSGTYRTSGSVVYTSKWYGFRKIKCGIYKRIENTQNLNLKALQQGINEIISTDYDRCDQCPFYQQNCLLNIAKDKREKEKLRN